MRDIRHAAQVGEVGAVLAGGDGLDGPMAEVAAWLVAHRYKVAVRVVDAAGTSRVFPGTSASAELVLVREPIEGRDDGYQFWGTESVGGPRWSTSTEARAGSGVEHPRDDDQLDAGVAGGSVTSADVADKRSRRAPRAWGSEETSGRTDRRPIEEMLVPPVRFRPRKTVAPGQEYVRRGWFIQSTKDQVMTGPGQDKRHIVPVTLP